MILTQKVKKISFRICHKFYLFNRLMIEQWREKIKISKSNLTKLTTKINLKKKERKDTQTKEIKLNNKMTTHNLNLANIKV